MNRRHIERPSLTQLPKGKTEFRCVYRRGAGSGVGVGAEAEGEAEADGADQLGS
jgi:hypothetical protein